MAGTVWRWLAGGLLCAVVALPGHGAGSRFLRTVDALAGEEEVEQRARFADIALLELAEIYLAEADLARGEAREAEQPAPLRAWAVAVERYAADLLSLAGAVEAGAPVALVRYPQEVPGVSVEGRTVLLAHPRAAQQPVFEQAVLERFCSGDLCARLVVAEPEPAPVAQAPVEPHWEFAAGASVCSYHRLELRFARADDLARRRDLCRQFLQEAETLALEIARQARYDVSVDWHALTIRALPGRPGHLVTLNRAGDSLLLELPLLASTTGLAAAITPWLRDRFAPEGPPPVSLAAADLGWE